ncbi:MAG: hypothetical protein H7Y17_15450 [Chlorobia bacterium]|nr:hypothetical protein [Fimbriimonadaceae bacterium]
MKAFFFLPLLALPSAVIAQKPSDWRRTNVKPAEFAKKVDLALLNLKDALGEATYNCLYPNGDRAQASFVNRIRDRKTFRVEFVKVADDKQNPVSNQTIIARSGQFTLLSVSTGFKPLASGKNPGLIPASMSTVSAWPRHFQQAMFSSYITGQGSFSSLVDGLTKGDGGYTIRMESRVMQGTRGQIPQMRLLAIRKGAAVKKFGPSTIEIVADTLRWLPMQVRVIQANLKKQGSFYDWNSSWKGGLRFDNKWFTTPGVKVATRS